MTWQLVHTATSADDLIPIPYSFTDSLIIVEAICNPVREDWHEAGWLYQLKDIPTVGITRSAYTKLIYLEKQEVKFDLLTPAPYTLEFVKRRWIPSITLNFWENDMPLFPSVNQPRPIDDGFADYQQSFSLNATTESMLIASADSSRRGISVYNPSDTAVLYLDFSSAGVQSASPLIEIPPRTRYVDDIKWRGEWYLRSSLGTAENPVSVPVRLFINGEPPVEIND